MKLITQILPISERSILKKIIWKLIKENLYDHKIIEKSFANITGNYKFQLDEHDYLYLEKVINKCINLIYLIACLLLKLLLPDNSLYFFNKLKEYTTTQFYIFLIISSLNFVI